MKPTFPDKVFVAGIGTGVGKTLVSAILAEALQADYWKPVQTGTIVSTDKEEVEILVSNNVTKVFENAMEFLHPYSPHYAASIEGRNIDISQIQMPQTRNRLVVEGAGGLLVPLNNDHLMIDLVKKWGIPVVLVAKHYLGSINHTLLSVESVRQRGIPLAGIVFNGDKFADNEEIITTHARIPVIGKVEFGEDIDRRFVQQQAEQLREQLQQHYTI